MTATKTKRFSSFLAGLGLFSFASVAAGAIGGRINRVPRNRLWYRLIRKSAAPPPPLAFATVWLGFASILNHPCLELGRPDPAARLRVTDSQPSYFTTRRWKGNTSCRSRTNSSS